MKTKKKTDSEVIANRQSPIANAAIGAGRGDGSGGAGAVDEADEPGGAAIAETGANERMKTGLERIIDERLRQIHVEGYDSKHDDMHECREIAQAALSYLGHYVGRAWVFTNELQMPGVKDGPKQYRREPAPDDWPWSRRDWKPQDPVRDLIKAGALIAAEIDRLQRLSKRLE